MIYDILKQRRDIILKKWMDATLKQYSFGGIKPNRSKIDRFANPVEYTVQNGLSIMLDELIDGIHTARLDSSLEDIIKIRSVQAEKPSDAVNFIFDLKKIITGECGNESGYFDSPGDLEELNDRIEGLIRSAFDIFMKSREKIYEIRKNEILRRSYKLLERADMMAPSLPEEGEEND
jgi:hypothetical protein